MVKRKPKTATKEPLDESISPLHSSDESISDNNDKISSKSLYNHSKNRLQKNGHKYLIIILASVSAFLAHQAYYEAPRRLSHLNNAINQRQLALTRTYDRIAFASIGHDTSQHAKSKSQLSSIVYHHDPQLYPGEKKAADQKPATINETKKETEMAVHLAVNMFKEGKYDKAAKVLEYALRLEPANTDALNYYGEYLEKHKKDVLQAEHMYSRALNAAPENSKAAVNRKRTLPLVTRIDREMLNKVDDLLKQFYEIPVMHPALKRAKREAYFMHIYHSNAIEGNTLNLQQTRHIIETRMAVNGKSLMEHQEVLGLDAAMRFINETLLYRPLGEILMQDILELHRRVLGFVDPIESGRFREHQVYVGSFVPPEAKHVYRLMSEFVEWLNSHQTLNEIHPVQLAALVHYKLAFIHPFYDGNGRTARLLMNLILMREGYPPVIVRKQDRLQYYEYLQMGNKGDIKPFIRFIARCTERTLREYILICNSSNGISAESLNGLVVGDEDFENLNLNEMLYGDEPDEEHVIKVENKAHVVVKEDEEV